MKPRCDFYSDTDPKALEVFLDLQRNMSPGKKVALVFESISLLQGMVESVLRRKYPDASNHEIDMRVASRRLDRETMIRVYAWDPEAH